MVNPLQAEFPSPHEILVPPAFAGERLDVVLAKLLPQYSRSLLQRWIDLGHVLLDGATPRRRVLIQGGEQLKIQPIFLPDTKVLAEELIVPLDVVHRDAAVMVINKPAGLVVHPGAGIRSGTLQNALLALEPALALVPRAGIVHRLDKDTSGLLIVARIPTAHAKLVKMLARREVGREYLALCNGVMTGGGTITEPIGRHRTQRVRMAVRSDGRVSVTHYRIERRFRGHTLARVELETGRTHQIRVHLGHIGYAIVGDPVYGGRKRLPAGASAPVISALAGFRRQALHATRLSFQNPITGKALIFEVPVPEDFAALLYILAAESGS